MLRSPEYTVPASGPPRLHVRPPKGSLCVSGTLLLASWQHELLRGTSTSAVNGCGCPVRNCGAATHRSTAQSRWASLPKTTTSERCRSSARTPGAVVCTSNCLAIAAAPPALRHRRFRARRGPTLVKQAGSRARSGKRARGRRVGQLVPRSRVAALSGLGHECRGWLGWYGCEML